MTERKPKLFDPSRPPEPKHFARIPLDILEDPRLTMSDIGVFAQLLKYHWTSDRTFKITQAELAKRCRMTSRNIRPHLGKFEKCGYIAREREEGGPTRITVTYQLRPVLEMSADLPIARGSKSACDRMKTSQVDRMKTSPTNGTFTSGGSDVNSPSPLLREIVKRELPPGGEREIPTVASAPAVPPPPPNSRHQECIDIAAQRWGACNGDYHVGGLLSEYSTELVREAIDRHFDKVGPRLKPALLRATCKGMLADGWKPEVTEPVTKPVADAKPREIIWGP